MTDSALPAAQFYHGTRYQWEAGQELTAAGAHEADPTYPAHIQHVWATTKPLAAAIHAKARSPKGEGRVYEVAPMGDLEVDPLDHGAQTSWRSRTGFRVVREASPADRIFDRAFGLEAGE